MKTALTQSPTDLTGADLSKATDLQTTLEQTHRAAPEIGALSQTVRNKVLLSLAEELQKQTPQILEANQKDIANGKEQNLSSALLDRLLLSPERLEQLAESVVDIARLEDPLGKILEGKTLRNGLTLHKKSVPIGVVLVIFESRPNVTIDIAALCLKSGNAAILRGGKEAIHSNLALGEAVRTALLLHDISPHAVQVIRQTDRALVKTLLQQKEYIDVVVPRGGESLINMVSENSRIPVIYHDKGVCHLYIEADADIEQAVSIALNSKVQRPGVCNAVETLLFHEDFPGTEQVLEALLRANVEIRGDKSLCQQFSGQFSKLSSKITQATEEDWSAEYLDLIVAAKRVPSLESAIKWINTYGSKHSDAILTQDLAKAEQFEIQVDSACVLINASTRFHDGGCFDMGSEIGISNQKLHVRGPMGINDLTTYKYVVRGTGHIRT